MVKPNQNARVTYGLLMDAVDTIMRGLDRLMEGINTRFDKLEAGQLENRRRIDDIKQDLADTPTRKEFNQLKAKVNRYHPAN